MSTCPACFEETPPHLMCTCSEPACTDCHQNLGHPGARCPDCPRSRGYFITSRDPHGYPITAICATCDGTGKIQ